MPDIIDWLLEDQNPAVRYRTQVELLGLNADPSQAQTWIFSRLPENWQDTKGLWYRYHIAALAECGLTHEHIPAGHLDRAFHELNTAFECSCADFMLLCSLTKFGLAQHESIQTILSKLNDFLLPDGGFLCIRRRNKLSHVPKSCYKANLHALMFAAACTKQGVEASFAETLAEYFLRRNLFYRSDNPEVLVLDGREGWRCIDTFHPYETMRVGIHSIVEILAALGYGNHAALQPAWEMLNRQKDAQGRVILSSTLTKSWLPKERIGKPSKWCTFYTLLAEKESAVKK